MTEFKINDIYNVNCLEMLQGMEDNSIDSLITDPPYGMSKDAPAQMAEIIKRWANGEDDATRLGKGFMNKEWDAFVPPPVIWKEIYRILKPGAYGLVFASTRTQDLMSVSMRFAGFQIKDVVEWLYFSGFPKSHNISKALDKRAGAEREVIGKSKGRSTPIHGGGQTVGEDDLITKAATPEAKKWDGWGTQLKPSHEPIILIQKPISEKTIADNVLKWGTGALNIDETRIEFEEKDREEFIKKRESFRGVEGNKYQENSSNISLASPSVDETLKNSEQGRFPANSITEDEDQFYSKFFNITPQDISKKAGKKDRNADYLGNEIDFKANNHPTVKSVPLMEHLIKMITPPEGTVLDPFLGSGTTLVAARRLSHEHPKYSHLNFIGSELSSEYFDICQARIFPETKQFKDGA